MIDDTDVIDIDAIVANAPEAASSPMPPTEARMPRAVPVYGVIAVLKANRAGALKTLTTIDRFILVLIADLVDHKKGSRLFASTAKLADLAGVSRSAVDASFKRLAAAGLLRNPRRRRYQPTTYDFALSALQDQTRQDPAPLDPACKDPA